MAHGLWNVMSFLPMMLIGGQQLNNKVSQWRRTRFERRAAAWPVVDGRVLGGSVAQVPYGGGTLTLTYDAFTTGHGIGLWKRVFATRKEAEHARDVLTGQLCRVHWDPADEQNTTLVWGEVETLLSRQPYVAKSARLGAVGYRWLAGYTGVVGAGLAASVAVESMAFAESSWCLCDAMIWLFCAGLVLVMPSFGITRRLPARSQAGNRTGVSRLLPASPQSVVLCCLLAAAVAGFLHYGPVFRALPQDAEIPQRVLAGTLGALLLPMYWYAFTAGVQGLRGLKPLRTDAAIPAAV